jgi:hypothetical protein
MIIALIAAVEAISQAFVTIMQWRAICQSQALGVGRTVQRRLCLFLPLPETQQSQPYGQGYPRR